MSRGGQPIASAYAEVGFRDTGFDAGIARATNRLSAFASAIPQLLGGAAVVTGFTMLVGQVTKTINALDSLRDRARETQTPIEQLSRLEFAGGLSGIEDVTGMLRFLQRNLAEAANGNKELSETFKRLGVDAGGFVASGRPAVELMSTLIDSLLRAPRAQGVRDAMQIFGRSGSEVFKFGSGAELTQGMAMADRVGATVTQEMADSADEFNDEIAVLIASLQTLRRDVVLPMIPALSEATRKVAEFALNLRTPGTSENTWAQDFMNGARFLSGSDSFGMISSMRSMGRTYTQGLASGIVGAVTGQNPFSIFGAIDRSASTVATQLAPTPTPPRPIVSQMMSIPQPPGMTDADRRALAMSERQWTEGLSSAANERYADAISAVFDRMDEINRMSSRVMPAMTGVGSWWDTAQNGIVSNDERERMRVAQESLDRLTGIAETAKETADILRERLASTPTFAN